MEHPRFAIRNLLITIFWICLWLFGLISLQRPTTSLITYVLLVAILGGPFVALRALVGDDWKEVAVWLISKIVVFVLCLVLSFSAAVAIRLLQGI